MTIGTCIRCHARGKVLSYTDFCAECTAHEINVTKSLIPGFKGELHTDFDLVEINKENAVVLCAPFSLHPDDVKSKCGICDTVVYHRPGIPQGLPHVCWKCTGEASKKEVK